MRRRRSQKLKEDYVGIFICIRLLLLWIGSIPYILYCVRYYIYLHVQKLCCVSLRRERKSNTPPYEKSDRRKNRRGMKKKKKGFGRLVNITLIFRNRGGRDEKKKSTHTHTLICTGRAHAIPTYPHVYIHIHIRRRRRKIERRKKKQTY